jgi:hypothetical protein
MSSLAASLKDAVVRFDARRGEPVLPEHQDLIVIRDSG